LLWSGGNGDGIMAAPRRDGSVVRFISTIPIPVKIKAAYFALAALAVAAVAAFLFYGKPSGPGEPATPSGTPAVAQAEPAKAGGVKRVPGRLVVGFSYNKPPYMMAKQGESDDPYAPGAKCGIEPDLFKAALAPTGRTFTLYSETLTRIALDAYDGTIDAAAVAMAEPKREGVYYSKEFLAFENVIITRKASNLTINSYADLKGKSIAAWQGASGQHPAAYAENLVKDNPNYFESTNQLAQYRMLAEHHVDVLVMDKYIFSWWHLKDPTHEEVVIHPILPKNPFHIAFRDRALRDAFDEGLERAIATGERDRIFKKYMEEASAAGRAEAEPSPAK
jgi:polar amino acid transport system substrate-binding protein